MRRFGLLLALLALAVPGCRRDPGAALHRGYHFLQAGQDTRADRQFAEAIALSQDKLRGVRYVLTIYQLNRRYKAAERLLGGLLDDPEGLIGRRLQRPEESDLREQLSGLLFEAGKQAEAVSQAEMALKLSPDDALLRNNLAYYYADAGRNLKEALKLAEKAHKAYPQSGIIADTLGWTYYQTGQMAKAVKVLADAAKLSPDEPEVRYHLGAAYAAGGARMRAKIELKKALVLDSSMSKARRKLADLKM